MAQDLIEKGTDHLEKNQYKEALNYFKKATEIDPKSMEAWFKLGLCYALIKKNSPAVKSFQKVLEIDPNTIDAWYFMGVAYEAGNKHKEALECYEAVLTINPNHALTWLQKGITYRLMKKPKKAVQSLEKSVEISPTSDSLRLLGSMYKDLGKKDKAKACFQQLIEMTSSEEEKKNLMKEIKKDYRIKL